jgi:hypothetical protein
MAESRGVGGTWGSVGSVGARRLGRGLAWSGWFNTLGDGPIYLLPGPLSPLPTEPCASPDRVNHPTTPLTPRDSTIFRFYLVILLHRQTFSGFAQSFCYSISHFATVDSTILLR